MAARKKSLTIDGYVAGLRAGDRATLARAITLVESSRPSHKGEAQELLQAILPYTGRAHRIGITGVPGVGKSTTIDQFGINLLEEGRRVAVLAVDPSSTRTGGSILGDKTRMSRLAVARDAFIRPSPSSGTLGGVARKTRETMALCEAAGFDVVIVETVGVGQSETTVAEMVDVFIVLLLAGGGDDLQGIKKGIIEIADIVAINKADGDNVGRATHAAADYRGALNILTPADAAWTPPVLTISGKENRGLDRLWAKIGEHRERMTASGRFDERRRDQSVGWMRAMLAERLMALTDRTAALAARRRELETAVRNGEVTAPRAVETMLAAMGVQGVQGPAS